VELVERGKGKENDRTSVILQNIRCEGRGYKDVYWKLLKNSGVGGKGVRESNWMDWTAHSKSHPQWAYIETPLWTST
jgi:hypothetical protein